MSANVERLLEEIKKLTPAELEQVRAALNEGANVTARKMTEDEFEAHLLAEGVISQRRRRPTQEDVARFRAYKPIEVRGKPISETLIEERR